MRRKGPVNIMETRGGKGHRVRMFVAWGLVLLCPLTAGASALSNIGLPRASDPLDRLGALEKARLAEAFHLRSALGEMVWPDWGSATIPVMLWNERYAFLVGHPDPPEGWTLVEGDAFRGEPYYRRPSTDPQAFTVRVGGQWVASMSTLEWTRLSLIRQIRQDLPGFLKPVFPYRFATHLYTSEWHIVGLLHESFHAYQAEAAAARFADAQQAYPAGGRYWEVDSAMRGPWREEIDWLAQAVGASSDAEARALACQFLTQRDQRRERQGLDAALVAYERRYEWLEGLAKYAELTAWRIAATSQGYEPLPALADDPFFKGYQRTFERRWSQELNQMKRQASRGGDTRFYYTGMAQAILLDRLMPTWKARVFSDPVWLEDLIRESCQS